MCDQITILAQTDAKRYVVCCEHGVTHVLWNNFSLRIRTEQLAQVAEAFHDLVPLVQQHRIVNNGPVCAVRDPHDCVQVWITGCGLYLKPEAFSGFVFLIQSAGRHPIAVDAALQTDGCRLTLAANPHQVRSHLFSMN